MCFNRKVMVGLGIVAVAAIAIAGWRGLNVLPALLLLACPLSMIAMMAGMGGGGRNSSDTPSTRAAGETDSEIDRLRQEVAELRQQQAAPYDETPTNR